MVSRKGGRTDKVVGRDSVVSTDVTLEELDRMNKTTQEMGKFFIDYWESTYGQMFRMQGVLMDRMSDASRELMSSMLDANMKLLENVMHRDEPKGGSAEN